MVMTFGILLFLVFVIEIAGGITAYVNRSEMEDFLMKNMNDTIQQHKKDAMKVWDEMQMKLHCCGVTKAEDWPKVDFPKSCCPQEVTTCSATENAYPDGCYEKILDKIKSAIGVVGGVAIGIAVVELIGVMFSWCLASAIKKEYEGV
nr:venom protein [Lampona murina]